MKKLLLLALSIVLLIGMTGCMEVKPKQEVDIKAEVEKYLKDKYNENFNVTGGGTESWNATDMEIYARSERFPDYKIMIRRGMKTGGMIDSYTGFLMKDEIDKIMTELITPIYPKSKVWYYAPLAPSAGTYPDMGVENYLEHESKYSFITLTICVSDPEYRTNKDEKAEELRKRFEEKKYKGAFDIFYMLDGKLEIINEDKKGDLYDSYTAKSWHSMKGSLHMNRSYQYRYIDWEETK